MKNAWVLSYRLSAQQRLWSDWAVAQADLSVRWAHRHNVGFVMRWLILGAPGRAYSIASSSAATDISQSSRKDWAKIRVALKQEDKQESEAIHRSKTGNISWEYQRFYSPQCNFSVANNISVTSCISKTFRLDRNYMYKKSDKPTFNVFVVATYDGSEERSGVYLMIIKG